MRAFTVSGQVVTRRISVIKQGASFFVLAGKDRIFLGSKDADFVVKQAEDSKNYYFDHCGIYTPQNSGRQIITGVNNLHPIPYPGFDFALVLWQTGDKSLNFEIDNGEILIQGEGCVLAIMAMYSRIFAKKKKKTQIILDWSGREITWTDPEDII